MTSLARLRAWLKGAVVQRQLFASEVRYSTRKTNRSGEPHANKSIMAVLPYRALEDARAFHEMAEHVRLEMIERLHEHGAPINVWRVGAIHGVVATEIAYRYGESPADIKDQHTFYVRTRTSIERPPFTQED